jgi:hypothetical protein
MNLLMHDTGFLLTAVLKVYQRKLPERFCPDRRLLCHGGSPFLDLPAAAANLVQTPVNYPATSLHPMLVFAGILQEGKANSSDFS